ncbi:MAG: hypothetical protein M0003_15950 [Acidithiobacillus sp.]|nr:hypothetical protein [Acidithiobacillus sp.]
MMKLLSNLPKHIVGVSASGQIDAKAYETVLIHALDAALQKHKRIRVLYQLTQISRASPLELCGMTPNLGSRT